MINKEITIEYPLNCLDKGAGSGHYIHDNGGNWAMKFGPRDNPRTCYYDNTGVKPEHRKETTHVAISEDEIYEGLIKARREAENACARLRNLQYLSDAVSERRNQKVTK